MIYGLFWLCFGQVDNNLVSQAGQMETHGIPNDMIRTINGISCIVLIPLAQKFLYPELSRRGIHFGPIARMTTGFLIVVLAMAYAAIVQKIIYQKNPCYVTQEGCNEGRKVDVFVQAPVYILLAAGEVLASVSGSEFAYNQAPRRMKSLVQALYVSTAGIGSVLGICLARAARDPDVMYLYASLAIAMFVATVLFWVAFRKHEI